MVHGLTKVVVQAAVKIARHGSGTAPSWKSRIYLAASSAAFPSASSSSSSNLEPHRPSTSATTFSIPNSYSHPFPALSCNAHEHATAHRQPYLLHRKGTTTTPIIMGFRLTSATAPTGLSSSNSNSNRRWLSQTHATMKDKTIMQTRLQNKQNTNVDMDEEVVGSEEKDAALQHAKVAAQVAG